MHELSIVFNIIETVEELGIENSLKKVSSVTLEVGEVSAVIPEYMTDCWKWAAEKSELLKGSELKVVALQAITYCDSCGNTYPTLEYKKICPRCKSEETYLLTGTEVNIKEIEAI